MFHLHLRLRHRSVGRPVKILRAGLAMRRVVRREPIFITPMTEERFVRIESFDLQEPVVLVVIAANEVKTRHDGPRLRLQLGPGQVLAIDPVLFDPRPVAGAAARRKFRTGHLPDPWVAFLAPKKFPRVVGQMVRRPARLEIMVVIGHQMAVHAPLFK